MNTLVELLEDRARARPDDVLYTFLENGEDVTTSITHRELDARARLIAAQLRSCMRVGDSALLVFAPGLDYIAAFFGCLYAGVIAVPAYPPDPRRLARTVPRLTAIARTSGARIVVTMEAIRALAASVPGLETLTWLAIDELTQAERVLDRVSDRAIVRDFDRVFNPDAIAFLQYTSGSTGAPRGVMLTHRAVLANLAAITDAFGLADRPPRTVSWLPPYHDMGLVGAILGSLYGGGSCVLMSPLHFLQQPVRWLRAITKYRADVSGGPNFAYDLCVRRVDPATEALDLSTWEIAFDGAEVVRADSLDQFAARFAPAGFRRTAFLPCYGLAETTLIAAATPRAAGPTVVTADAAALEAGRLLEVEPSPHARMVVSSGKPTRGTEIAIVDPAGRACDGTVGEIWLTGTSVGTGYWDDAEATALAFGARLAGDDRTWLRTGDLGVLHAGELFVTGRIKDVIIISGRNLAPDDLEQVAVAAHPALRPGGTAAFAIEISGREQLVIVQELAPGSHDAAAIQRAIRTAVVGAFDVAPHDVLLVEPGAIPKTSSGKVQRHACKADYVARCAASSETDG
ncbi:MAG: fatty acyl-AMP ligase [Kofleriaceae bacterium]